MKAPRRFHYIIHSEEFAVVQMAMTVGERMRALGALLNEAYERTGARPEDDVVIWDEQERQIALGTGVRE